MVTLILGLPNWSTGTWVFLLILLVVLVVIELTLKMTPREKQRIKEQNARRT